MNTKMDIKLQYRYEQEKWCLKEMTLKERQTDIIEYVYSFPVIHDISQKSFPIPKLTEFASQL